MYLDGGASHIDLLDLKPDAPAEIRGPYRPIATSAPGVEIGELLPNIARQMHRAVLVRSMRHTETVHDPAVYQMLTGYKHPSNAGGLKVEETDLPHMASAFERACAAGGPAPGGMPRSIELPETMHMQGRILPGQNAGILGAPFDPFRVPITPAGVVEAPPFARRADIGDARFDERTRLLRGLESPAVGPGRTGPDPAIVAPGRWDLFRDQAFALLDRPDIARAFELDREPVALQDRYGHHRHGRSLLLARRLVGSGIAIRDGLLGSRAAGHGERQGAGRSEQSLGHAPESLSTARAVALPPRGSIAGGLTGGPRPAESAGADARGVDGRFRSHAAHLQTVGSRDHWPHAFSLLLAGGGLEGGRVVGRTDRTGSEVLDDAMSPADLTATIFERLGLDPRRSVPAARGGGHRLSQGRVPEGLRG